MARRFHVLKKNHAGEAPRQMAFVDTEATRILGDDGIEHQTLMMGYCEIWTIRDWDTDKPRMAEAFIFRTKGEFWERVLPFPRPRTKLHIFAHNWQYDAAILSVDEILERPDTRIMKIIADGGIFFIKMRIENRSYQFVDTTNLFPGSLARLGQSIGLEKLTMPETGDNADNWELYCKNDVAIVREGVFMYLRFITSNDLGNFQPTLAGQSFSAYRHRFMHNEIFIHDDEKVLQLERNSYYGGRVECWHVGVYDGQFIKLDINSMYPASMISEPMPVKYVAYRPNGTPETLRKAIETHLCVARVDIETDEPAYPLRGDDKLIFPVGKFTTTLCTPELRYALEHGHIKRVHEMALYLSAVIFQEYVSFFYGGRLQYQSEGNVSFSYMCKLLLNSLYGKFGQRQGSWQDTNEFPAPPDGAAKWTHIDEKSNKPRLLRVIAGQVQEQVKGGEAYNSFPAVAAHVTSYARMSLWGMMKACGLANLWYIDTDSLMVNPQGLESLLPLIDASKLGMLKVEGEANHVIINGPKDYTFGASSYLKGVSNKAKRLAENTFSQPQFEKWSTGYTKGVRGEVRVKDVTKTLTRRYDKGIVHSDGHVSPLVLP